jgi:hypothetical protein
MRDEKEIEDKLDELVEDYVRCRGISDAQRRSMKEIRILDWVLNHCNLPCYNCLRPEWQVHRDRGYHCPVCDDTKEVRPYTVFIHEEEERIELEKVKEEWGIA